ncbi:MAG: AraC family transcriptional regulator [Zoogloeaceae bacterium]|jgi:AraC-like DNA-binding protein|nr:AraC family transcriptional regulator [Zoogloeaceae bacterium]
MDTNQTHSLLKAKLLQLTSGTGHYPTAIQGLSLYRQNESNQTVCSFYRPFVAVVLQGCKHSLIGSEAYRYGEGYCLINGIDIPSVNQVVGATAEAPFLSVSLDLDGALIRQLASEVFGAEKMDDAPMKGMAVAPTDPEVADAFWRLIKLLDSPTQMPALAALMIREIHYRLLTGAQGAHLRSINTQGTHNHQIFRALARMRQQFRESVEIDGLAHEVGMAASTFRRHFKTVTRMSPLQYQKHLRLYEAQRLMLTENIDATRASYAVGYASATQFSREYKRLFGKSPKRSVTLLRQTTAPMNGAARN